MGFSREKVICAYAEVFLELFSVVLCYEFPVTMLISPSSHTHTNTCFIMFKLLKLNSFHILSLRHYFGLFHLSKLDCVESVKPPLALAIIHD